jgi:hypothetical protein
MRTFFLLVLFIAGCLRAESYTAAGQKQIRRALVTWGSASGTYTGKTRIMYLGNSVYVDTSTTGQTGAWLRVDNAADSCSSSFFTGSDSNGADRPIWEYRLWETVRSVDKDSSTHVYRVQTKERVYDNAIKNMRFTPWTLQRANQGYTGVTVQDSIVVLNAGTTSKLSQYSLGMFLGSWARLCPDDIAGTANAATDSVFADSIFVFTR